MCYNYSRKVIINFRLFFPKHTYIERDALQRL
nr:MAG TPA: hypothetical protein [Caudoviricetes sp.]